MNDEVKHERRRNVAIVAAVLIIGVGMVAAMFGVVRSMTSPTVALSAVSTPSATDSTSATTATPVPSTSSFTPPAPSWVGATTLSLPPAAQPTLTDPVPGQTADPDPDATVVSTTPGGQPSLPQPTSGTSATQPSELTQPTQPTQPTVATVSNVNLSCSRSGSKKIAARLTFTTTAQVTVAISAGGTVNRQQVGTGDASVEASGKGPAFCAAVVDGQPVGPIPAS